MIVALDVENAAAALQLVEKIGPATNFYKVGMELYAAAGMEIVSQLGSSGKNVFLDLKLYDIAETVKRATRQICQRSAPTFLTVHGSRAIMQAAVEGRGDSNTKLLAVTVLTSFDQEDMADLGFSVPVSVLVELRVRKAVESGMDGVVCSPLEIARVREIGGPKLIIVTPGVRSIGAAVGDQKRVATPADAMRDGANYLVIGRQVTRASNPEAACQEILAEIAAYRTPF
ncbi:MAG: orotidine-5'-phosphate decarboxylase [Bryobacteraceae bacterium]